MRRKRGGAGGCQWFARLGLSVALALSKHECRLEALERRPHRSRDS